jgi:alpha-1,6-mannosyltransferase
LVVFTNYRFPVVWSMAAILSYAGYSEVGYTENLYLVLAEYTAVVFTMIWDLTREGHWSNRNGLNMVSAS